MTLLGLYLFVGSAPHALPSAEEIREKAAEVLGRPEYRLAPASDTEMRLWNALWRMLIEPFIAFLNAMHDFSPALAWLVTGLLLITVVLLVGHIVWTIVNLVRPEQKHFAGQARTGRRVVSETELVRQATAAADQGDYMTAIRVLFRVILSRLEQVEGRPFRPGLTNRHHLNRYRNSPIHEVLALFVSTIDQKWYGLARCEAADYTACQQGYEQVVDWTREHAHAKRS